MRLLRMGVNRVMIETWNEFHEGTDIAHSREYGRHYLELNRQYADLFKARYVPPPFKGPSPTSQRSAWISVNLKIPRIRWG